MIKLCAASDLTVQSSSSILYEPVHEKTNKRTNGPVNAHLRSAAYSNKHV